MGGYNQYPPSLASASNVTVSIRVSFLPNSSDSVSRVFPVSPLFGHTMEQSSEEPLGHAYAFEFELDTSSRLDASLHPVCLKTQSAMTTHWVVDAGAP